MKILVLGGAGYIGSHMVKMLAAEGYDVVTVDNLSTGHREQVKYGQFIQADLGDKSAMADIFAQHSFAAVMHFAAASLVGESMTNPRKYYRNNMLASMNLLDTMLEAGVTRLVFSSTAAVYGEPHYTPIDEKHPTAPINPYGASKRMVEQLLHDYCSAYQLSSVSLRYFNACGADAEGELGECHEPETHLIPLILQAASGRRDAIRVFGRDYPTADGTCVRDYIHVEDLCRAHIKALEHLLIAKQPAADIFNLGIGQGFSVQQVIDVAATVVAIDDKTIHVIEDKRRAGDPAVLVADAQRAREQLKWVPEYTDLQTIITHAWQWEKQLRA